MFKSAVYTEQCVHGTLPPCSCACPANFKLREFMGKVAAGQMGSAYRQLVNELLFPEIATRICGGVCGGACAENIDVLELERACIRNAINKIPLKFSVAQKREKVAILGAGLSGLACALRLSARGFGVTLFDARDEIGGTLGESVEKSVYLEEFALQFKHSPYTFEANRTVESPDELAGFDAVYIATGRDGNDFGLLPGWDNRSMATTRDGWFLGGELTVATKFEALVQGRIASISIEKYLLLSANMSGAPESFIQRECLFEAENSGAVSKPHADGFSAEGAKEEAGRCRRCDCTICYDNCKLMQSVQMYPPKIEGETYAAVNPEATISEQQGSRMVFSCAACGHCGSVCPKGISLESLFVGSKQALFRMGKYPPALHAFYLGDMADANGANHLLKLPESGKPATHLFFPGCQATSSGGGHVRAAYGYLQTHLPDTALMLSCCGVPALWSGDSGLFQNTIEKLRVDWARAGSPVVIAMCPTCMKTFREHLPQIEVISLYEVMERYGLPEGSRGAAGGAAVFDPCSSRDFADMQRSVRTLSKICGATLEELAQSGKTASCCGHGGNIYSANRSLAAQFSQDAADMSALPYITYCENCRNAFLLEGKECRHVLDDAFGLEPLKKPPHIDELRKNRTALRCELEGIPMPEQDRDAFILEISAPLYEKMDRALVSSDELRQTVRHCEETGKRFLNEETGSYIGSLKIGHGTFWAEYVPLGESRYKLINAYVHRLNIVGVQHEM